MDYENSKILTFRPGIAVNILNNGEISFSTFRVKYHEGAGTISYTSIQKFTDPFEYVWVHFEEGIPGTKFEKGANFLMPVYQAVFIFKTNTEKN